MAYRVLISIIIVFLGIAASNMVCASKADYKIYAQRSFKSSKLLNKAEVQYTDTIIIGDLNNDKVGDTAFVTGPKYKDENDEAYNCTDCSINISFTGGFKPIYYNNAITAGVENIGDIDEDGICEIIIVPGWFVGCWGTMRFYTYKNSEWIFINDARTRLCEEESFLPRIKKISRAKIKVSEQVWSDDGGDIIYKPKLIHINVR